MEEVLDDAVSARLGEGFGDVGGGTFGVAVEDLAEAGALVAEGGVEAGAVDAPMASGLSGLAANEEQERQIQAGLVSQVPSGRLGLRMRLRRRLCSWLRGQQLCDWRGAVGGWRRGAGVRLVGNR